MGKRTKGRGKSTSPQRPTRHASLTLARLHLQCIIILLYLIMYLFTFGISYSFERGLLLGLANEDT